MYSCVSDWLKTQPNCIGEIADATKEGVRRFSLPFSNYYPCDVVAPPGSFVSLPRPLAASLF